MSWRRARRRRRPGSGRRSVPNPTLLGLAVALGAVLLIQACTNREIVSVIVTAVSVTPPAGSMVEGDTLRFRAIVTDDRGGSLNGVPVAWSVTDSSVISVDEDGMVTALSRGTARVRAEFRGEMGEATVEVFLAPRIDLDPAALAFFGGVDGAPIPPQDVAVTNAGGDRLEGLAVEIRYAAGQPTDWLDAVLGRQIAPTTLAVSAISTGLQAGQYSADILVTSTTDRVANSPETIPVTLSLSDFAVVESGGSTEVTEAGSMDDFTVALGKQPDSDVVLFVTSADEGEVTANPAGLTFTPGNWDVPQTVTVTGVDDLVDDGDVLTSIVISVDDANSDDAFDPTPDFEVVVTTLDDDTAGMVVTQTNGGTLVNEAGTMDTLSVVLESEPASLVVINVVTQDAGEASVSPDQLTFDATNWTVPQVVVVTGVDDFVIDGDVQTDVVVEVDTLATTGPYAAVPSQTVTVTTEDDDTGALILSRNTASVDETGAMDSVTVTLSVMPDSAVTLAVASDDIGEVTAAPNPVVIEPADWNVGAVITFTGVDDLVSDGPQLATVTVSVLPASSDGDFDAAAPVTVDVTNADNDSPGFQITESDGGTTVSESGTTDDFQVVLNTQPQSGTVVALDLVSPAPAEVTVSPTAIQFDETNWSTPVTVTLTGVDDGEDDGDEVTDVTVSIGGDTTDPDYSSVPAQAVSVTTIDTKLLIVEGGGTTVVGEIGTTDNFSVALSHAPASNVVVSVVSDDPGEATVDKSQLTFTPSNWSTTQSVTVTGVDDLVDDGDQVTDVRLTVANGSSDPLFHDVADTVEVTTTDNDGAGIEVIEIGGTVVTESGFGNTDQFDVRLSTRPAPGTSVVLDVSSGDTGEATVDKAQLSFTPGNWNTPQTVTVTGVADNRVDGDQNTDVTISVNLAGTSDPAYTVVSDRIVGVTTTDVDVATLTVGNTSNTEGGNIIFSVSLSDAVEGGLSVDVTLADGTAVSPVDYDGGGGTLNFAGTAGEIEQFSVPTVGDAIVEGNETFTLSLSTTNPAVDDTDTATGTILDNDVSAVTVNNAAATEGGDLTFNVTLGNAVQGGLTVDVTLIDGTATGGAAPLVSPEDYNNVVGQLTFAGTAGEVEQFTVATLDDAIVEGPETFTVSLSASNASVDDSDGGTGTINDNDNAAVTVDNAAETEGDGLTFTVTLDNAVAGGFTVDVTLTDGTATGGAAPLAVPEDYDNVVAQLAFAGTAGETQQFTVATLDDPVFEGTETFTVALSASSGAVDDSDGGTGTILDNDGQPTVTLLANPTSLPEDGSANPSVVTATLSNPSSQPVTVTLGFSGTASLTDDYTRTGTQIVIPAGSLSRNRQVSAVQDNEDEPDETVIVDITNVTNGTEQGTQQQTITIVDDDLPTVTLSASQASLSENGTNSPSVVTATLSSPATLPVTVSLGFSGTATLTADYTRTGTQISIPVGSSSGSIDVNAVQDVVYEPGNETVIVDITGVTNGTESGTQQQTITIVDDDSAPTVTLGAAPLNLNENGSNSPSVVTATLSNPTTQPVTVTLGFSGTATLTADYTRSGTSIVIPPLSTTGTVNVNAVQDAVYEPGANETVVVDITGVTNGTESGTQQQTISIVDDDSAPTVTLGAAPSSLNEDGSNSPSVVTATLSNPSTQPVTVTLGFSGTATLTTDYTRSGTSIVIPALSTTGTITISAVDDSGAPESEANETVVIDIASVTNGTEQGTQQTTITIVDDDGVPTVMLGATPLNLNENGSNSPSVVTATLSNPSSQEVTVSLGFSGSATLTADYSRSGTQISIPPGSSSGSIDIDAVQDVVHEPGNETVIVDITGVTNATESGTQQQTITIVDDDSAPMVTLGAAPSSLRENGSDNPSVVTATLSNPTTQAVTVTLGFSGTATLTADYTRSATSIMIPALSTTGTVDVNAVQDAVYEPGADETVVVAITGVTNGSEQGNQSETITIVDDDSAPSVTLGAAPSSLNENGSNNPSVVTATLSNPTAQAVTVTLGFTGTATLTADYTRSGTSIVIPALSTTGTVDVNAVQDAVYEPGPNETVVVAITGVTNGSEQGNQSETITIIDDDSAPTVTLAAAPTSLDEDGSTNPSVVTATLSNPSTQLVTVNLGFSGTATLTTDYTRSGTSIGVPALSTSGTVTIGAVDDSGAPEAEPDETVVIDIASVTNGTEQGTQQTTVTILDDDSGPASVTLVTSPPATAVSSVTFTQSPVAEVLDINSNPVVGQDVTVTLASGGGSLGGTTTVATDGSGRATFSNLSITTSSPGERTLQFVAEGENATSGPVHVSHGQGTYLDVQYCGSLAAQRMDVSIPSNSFARPLPVAAYVHGGAWVSGTKTSGTLLTEVRDELLARGYVVVSLDYRLATSSTNPWPAQIEDVKCAVRHLKAEAADYGADETRIGAWGHSAGGHLVSMLGVTDGSEGFEGTGGYAGESSRVEAVVPMGGISDLTQGPDHLELNFFGPEWTFSTWPGPSQELTDASPITWSSVDDPPFLIVHGTEDTVVDPAQAQRLFDVLDLDGVDATLQLVTNGSHGFSDTGGPATPSRAQLAIQIADFFDTHVRFGS